MLKQQRILQSVTGDETQKFLSPKSITVLLVDDQPMIGETVRRILANETDIEFHTISDPTRAIEKAINLTPTVILLDMVMPDIDGLMLLRWLRSHHATCHIPIIMLSSKEESKLKAQAFTDGANDYLIKLPDAVELTARIRYHSRAYNNLIALNQAAETAQTQNQKLEQALQELQQTQVQLIQSEKMSSLGRMVAGIAHEINNPVNFIHGNLVHLQNHVDYILELASTCQQEYMQSESQSEEDEILDFVTQDLSKIMSSMRLGTDRIRNIVKSMRNFSRLDEADKKLTDIHEGIEGTLLILSSNIKCGIEIIKEYGDLPLVECYPAQLNQVFMNILSNAMDVLLENPDRDSRQIRIKTYRIGEQKIGIAIQDNGPGMSAETKAKIFEPFFTTKATNKGTGLGLAISYRIIEKHRGQIIVESTLENGTEFIIEVPKHIQE